MDQIEEDVETPPTPNGASHNVQVTMTTDQVTEQVTASTDAIESSLNVLTEEIARLDTLVVSINEWRQELSNKVSTALFAAGITPLASVRKPRKAAATGEKKPRKKKGDGPSHEDVLKAFGSKPKTATEAAEKLGVDPADIRYSLKVLKDNEQIELAPGSATRGPTVSYVKK